MAELKRVLGYPTIISLSIASIMGTGLFFGAAVGASYAGNASLISWAILAVFALYIAMLFGELSSMFPKAGGVYEFSKHAYGRFPSFLVGWVAWIVGNITTTLMVVAALDILLPDPNLKLLRFLIAFGILLVLNVIAFLGIEASSSVLVFFAGLAFLIVLGIAIPGLFHINLSNFSPFFTMGTGAIFVAVFFLAESFFGWESATYLSEETKNPEKVIPRSLVIGTIVVALFTLSLAFVSLGVIPWQELVKAKVPLNLVSTQILGGVGASIIGIGVFLVLAGSAMGGVVTMPRLLLALARDKLFLSQFDKVHERFHTPHRAVIFQAVISLIVLLIAFGKYKLLLSMLMPLGFLMYMAIILAVPILRVRHPEQPRPFKAPLGFIGPILAGVFILSLFIVWLVTVPNAPSQLMLGLSLVFFGIPLYFLVMLYNDPKAVSEVNDLTAYFVLLTERINIPLKVRREVLELLGDVQGKAVLEYGCGVGTLTTHLAEAVGPKGRIYAVDLSLNDLRITQQRLERLQWESKNRVYGKVHILHDEHQAHRVHPSIRSCDAVVSIGMMGYLQDIKKVLREMHAILPDSGRLVFVEYGDFFSIIPNVEWLSKNEVIEQVFRECGFSVRVMRKKGLFWNYIYVYGAKLGANVSFI
ncbi:MAG: amino acid permease [Nanoarchaeota archaeon]